MAWIIFVHCVLILIKYFLVSILNYYFTYCVSRESAVSIATRLDWKGFAPSKVFASPKHADRI